MDMYNIQKNGKFGCPRCYNNFYEYIFEIVSKCQDDTKHIGKIPKNNIKYLEKNLENMIKEENYEEAIILRDKIKQLTYQSQLNQNSNNLCS